MTKSAKQVHTLEDLLVEEVSVVDRPANKRRFLTVKAEDGKGQEIQVGPDGKLITPDGDPSGDTTDTTPIDQAFAAIGKTLADVEKRLTIHPDMRREIFQGLQDNMGRISAVMASADFAQSDRDGSKGPSKLVPILSEELMEVAKELAALGRKIGKTDATKGEGGDDPPATDGEDPTKALETLVAGLEETVQKRGAKMSKARLAAFKAAMKTLGQILAELDPEAQKDDTKKAKKQEPGEGIARHVHTFSQGGQTWTTTPVDVPEGRPHTHSVTIDGKKLTTNSVPNTAGHAQTVQVNGKTLTSSPPKAPNQDRQNDKGKKTATTKAEGPAPELVALQKMVETLTTTVKKQAKDLRTLRMARPGSNAIPVEKGAGDGPPRSEVSWPLDMNDEKTPQRVDKATSFLES